MCIRDSTLSKTDVAGPLWPSFCCSCCHCWTAVINKCALADVGERVFSQMFGMDFDMRELSRDCPQMCIEPGIFALVFPSRSDLAGRGGACVATDGARSLPASLHGVIGRDAGCRFAEPKHRHDGAIFGPKLGLPCMPALAQDLVLDLEKTSSNRGGPPQPPQHPA